MSNGLENFPKITGKDRRKVSSSCEGLLVIYRFFPLFKSIGIVASFQNIAVMRDAIQQRRGHFGVVKNLRPFPEIEIGGDDRRGFLVLMTDNME